MTRCRADSEIVFLQKRSFRGERGSRGGPPGGPRGRGGAPRPTKKWIFRCNFDTQLTGAKPGFGGSPGTEFWTPPPDPDQNRGPPRPKKNRSYLRKKNGQPRSRTQDKKF